MSSYISIFIYPEEISIDYFNILKKTTINHYLLPSYQVKLSR